MKLGENPAKNMESPAIIIARFKAYFLPLRSEIIGKINPEINAPM